MRNFTNVIQIKTDEMGVKCNTHGRGDNIHKILYGNPERKRLFGTSTCSWEDIIRRHHKTVR
jgi:hypothetical protein